VSSASAARGRARDGRRVPYPLRFVTVL